MSKWVFVGLSLLVGASGVNAETLQEAKEQPEKTVVAPVITRVDDAGIGFLTETKREDLHLNPTANWNVDFADDSCGLTRVFGEGDQQVMLDMRQFAPNSDFDLTVAGPSLVPRREKLAYAFVPVNAYETRTDHIMAKFGNGYTGVVFGASFMQNIDEELAGKARSAATIATAKKITMLSIQRGFARRIHLQTGPLDEAMGVMNQCTQGLLKEWGLKPDEADIWPSMAKPANESAFVRKVQDTFPKRALGKSGIARIRLTVDERGGPTSCHLQVPTEKEAFKQAACAQLMRYANFIPVLDSSGTPIPSYYVVKVSYIS